jgi:exosome complex component RRP46
LLACALNCICLALLNANIPLRYTFAAVNCALLDDSSNQIIYFPTAKQEKESHLVITFVFDSINRDIISVNTNGPFDQDQFNYLLDNARQYAADKIFSFQNQLITKEYLKD